VVQIFQRPESMVHTLLLRRPAAGELHHQVDEHDHHHTNGGECAEAFVAARRCHVASRLMGDRQTSRTVAIASPPRGASGVPALEAGPSCRPFVILIWTGPFFGSPGEFVIITGDSKHHALGVRVGNLSSHRARLCRAQAPVLGIAHERTGHEIESPPFGLRLTVTTS